MGTIRSLIIFNLMLLAGHAGATTYFVNVSNTVPLAPYTDWSTAATNIQDAIDAASDGDLVLVTNGVYATGGRVVYGALTNRVVINKALTVQSVNGPIATLIQGYSVLGNNAVRCVYMASNSTLCGFTITNGGTLSSGDSVLERSGGGILAADSSSVTISNCLIQRNFAHGSGGGAYYGNFNNCSFVQNSSLVGGGLAFSSAANCLVLSNYSSLGGGGISQASARNCRLVKNISGNDGGGATVSALYGCLVSGNIASGLGGGTYSCQDVVNCTIVYNASTQGGGGAHSSGFSFLNNIVYYNSVSYGTTSNYAAISSAKNCCGFPLLTGSPTLILNNITNEPAFVNSVNEDFHLQNNSPCINSGTTPVSITTDLDGNLRQVDGFADIGAYENQTPTSILPFQFAQRYGLSIDGSLDSDGDGMNNWQEAYAGTNPTNAASILKMSSISTNAAGITVKWLSIANRIYIVQRATNLTTVPAFTPIYTNFPIPLTSLSFTDTSATNGGPYFYRVGVQ